MSWDVPIVARLLTTGGILASVVTGLLFIGQWDHHGAPSLGQVTPASPEMVQLLRDEHDLVADMVKAQLSLFSR
jgi:hypothetical protein